MTTTYSLFGISMHRRSTRRRFVLFAYIVFAIVCTLTVAFIRVAPYFYEFAIYAILIFTVVVFGWQGHGGLIKPFPNKPTRREPSIITMIELQLAPQRVLSRGSEPWRNDERELGRRNAAHYSAYQPLYIAFTLLLSLTAIANHPWPWISVPVLMEIIFAVTLVSTVLAVTLPAAIILWTEPDHPTAEPSVVDSATA